MEEDEDKSWGGSEGGADGTLDELMAELRDSDRKLPQYPQVSEWQDDNLGVEEEKDPHGSPSKEILWAAENGEIELVRKLLKSDPSLVDSTDKDGYTPLHRASYNNHYHIAKLLLENGANIDARTVDDWQPLHSACKWNSIDCATLLISRGADVNALSKGGVTGLHLIAGQSEGRRLIELLLSQPELKVGLRDSSGDTPEDIARRCGPHHHLFAITQPPFL